LGERAVRRHGKRYREAARQVEPRLYEPEEALALVQRLASAKFDETVEAAFRLGVDPRHPEEMVRGAVALPHGLGRAVRVAVFARGDRAREAEQAGADVVGGEDLVQKVQGGWLEFDVAVATPDMMASVGRLGRILGPRGLMPNPKSGTVTFDVATAVREIKAGKVEFRTERAGVVHAPIGKVSFETRALVENFYALLDALYRNRPAAAKGTYIRSITVSSTMGPGVRINPLVTAPVHA
jgi:large subunit ribosomal protein L1